MEEYYFTVGFYNQEAFGVRAGITSIVANTSVITVAEALQKATGGIGQVTSLAPIGRDQHLSIQQEILAAVQDASHDRSLDASSYGDWIAGIFILGTLGLGVYGLIKNYLRED
jgi:hypothetical protein